jgi:membrane protein involved in colicin uptake
MGIPTRFFESRSGRYDAFVRAGTQTSFERYPRTNQQPCLARRLDDRRSSLILKTLEQLGEQDEFSQNLTKAEASRRIDALKSKLGRKRTAEARHRKNQARLTRMAEGVRESSL